MFTGIIQRTGKLAARMRSSGGWRLRVEHAPWEQPLETGESVAVQGACLTGTACHEGGVDADLLDETHECTTLGRLPLGARVNLERALRLGDRLGGHIVSGHVDESGRVAAIEARGRDFALTVSCSPALARMTIFKGSIAIDGISLTVSELRDQTIGVLVIPHTWAFTSLGDRKVGDPVNLEADVLGKHVARLLGREREGAEPFTKEDTAIDMRLLERSGFMDVG